MEYSSSVVSSAAIAAALAATPVNLTVPNGLFTKAASVFDPSALEALIQGSGANLNVLAAQNTNIAGFSAYTVRSYDNKDMLAIGLGNPSVNTPVYVGRNYIETISAAAGPLSNGNVSLPTPLVFTTSGVFGRDGTPGNFRIQQRMTLEDTGLYTWKGLTYINGSEQKAITVNHEGGYFGLMNNVAPNAIDILNNTHAFWFDSSAGAPVLKCVARDINGVLYSGTATSLAAATATASDTFTAADSATALNARTPVVGAVWTPITNNWGIISNKAYRSGGTGADGVVINTGLSDCSVECDITLSAVRAVPGLMIRYVDSSNYTYVQIEKDGGGNTNTIGVFVTVAGTATKIGAFANTTLTLGQTYKVRAGAVGKAFYVYVDGVLKLRCEDATHIAATRQGLFSFANGSTDDLGSRWDNFVVYP